MFQNYCRLLNIPFSQIRNNYFILPFFLIIFMISESQFSILPYTIILIRIINFNLKFCTHKERKLSKEKRRRDPPLHRFISKLNRPDLSGEWVYCTCRLSVREEKSRVSTRGWLFACVGTKSRAADGRRGEKRSLGGKAEGEAEREEASGRMCLR